MTARAVGESVRPFEAWVYRQAFRQNYRGGDNPAWVGAARMAKPGCTDAEFARLVDLEFS